MVKHSCHVHLTGTIREVMKPPHNMVQVSPAGAGETCDFGAKRQKKGFGLGWTRWFGGCGKPALWAVNPA